LKALSSHQYPAVARQWKAKLLHNNHKAVANASKVSILMEESVNDKALEEFKIQGRSLRPGSTSLFYGQGILLFSFIIFSSSMVLILRLSPPKASQSFCLQNQFDAASKWSEPTSGNRAAPCTF